MRNVCVALALAAAMSAATPAHAQTVLTLSDVLSRARAEAPRIVSARMVVDDVRTRLLGASLKFQSNPEIDLGIGRRSGQGDRSIDLDVGVTQLLGSRGRRAADIAAVNAQVDEASASATLIERDLLREVAVEFHRAVYAGERLALAQTAETLATNILRTAERRHQAGDLTILEVNLARSTLARTRADRQSAEADRAHSLGVLGTLLGLAPGFDVRGTLSAGPPVDVAVFTRAADQRPELQVIEAALREAEALHRVARSEARPAWGLGFRFQREERRNILFAGATIALPVVVKGQELFALSDARSRRLRADLEATRTRLQLEVAAAHSVYERRVAAVRALEADALPTLDDNDALITRSFDAGQIGLPEALLLRRESLDARFEHLSALLEVALARVALDAAAAVLR